MVVLNLLFLIKFLLSEEMLFESWLQANVGQGERSAHARFVESFRRGKGGNINHERVPDGRIKKLKQTMG